jgi:lipid A 4'-phosphatase
MPPPSTATSIARPWRARQREALAWLLTALALGAVFGFWPSIDLAVTQHFYAGAGDFPWRQKAWVIAVYVGIPWLGWSMALAGLVTLLVARWRPDRVPRRWRHRAAAVLACMLLGVVGVVHGVLKDHWGRPRPVQVAAFGGAQAFVPMWQPVLHRLAPSTWPAVAPPPAGEHNQSFVSGHVATGFALMAIGLFGAPATRRRWRWIALVAGCTVAWVRIAQGGHFASDTLFAGVAIWATCLVLREVGLRWRVRRRRSAGRAR